MHPALLFFLGLFIGVVTISGIWYSEYYIRHAKERRKIEQLKEETQNHVFLMLDSLPEGYIVVNGEGEILRAAKLAKSFGLIVEDSLRANIAEMVHSVIVTGKSRDVEFDMVKTLKRERRARRIWVRIAKVTENRAVIFLRIRLKNAGLQKPVVILLQIFLTN
ncbi:hypothetical protein RQN30_08445 [Arcanobacterium hippocoleae]